MRQSKYRGVFWSERGYWRVFIKHNGKRLNLGTFPELEEEGAGRKYNQVAKRLLGDFATLNYFEDEHQGERAK